MTLGHNGPVETALASMNNLSAPVSITGSSVAASMSGSSAPQATTGSSAPQATTDSSGPAKSDGVSSHFVVSPKQIIQIPKVLHKGKTRNARKCGSSVILTTSSYKKTLMEATNKQVSTGVTKRSFKKTVPKRTLLKDVIKKQNVSSSKKDAPKDSHRMQPCDLPSSSTRNACHDVLCIFALRHMPPQDQVKCGSSVEVAEIGPMNFVPTMNLVHLHVNFVSHK